MAEREAREAVKSFEAICREIIYGHLPEYEKAIGLTAPNHEFRSRLTDAIATCAFQHMFIPYQKRPSGWRKELTQASKEARTAQNSLRRLVAILDGLPQAISDRLATHWGLLGEIAHRSLEREISWLVQVSVITSMYAEIRDRGGASRKLAFEVLANGLADAYQIATGKPAGVTWNPCTERYEGKFLRLAEAVLPLASKLAGTPQRKLRVPWPGKYALGKYLSTLTTARKKKRTRP